MFYSLPSASSSEETVTRISMLDSSGASNNSAALPEACISMDQEIKVISKTLSIMTTRRNSLLPVSRIPPGTMARIFEIFSTDGDDDIFRESETRSRRSGSYGNFRWIKVSHVCRAWRAIALDDTKLWGMSIRYHPAWVAERMRSLKLTPTDVMHRGQLPYIIRPLDNRLLHTVLSELHHTPHLSLQGVACKSHLLAFSLLSCAAAPLLESFSWDTHALLDPGNNGGNFFLLPNNIFGENAPQLHRLSLREALMPPDAPLCGRLVDLRLSFCVQRLASVSTCEQLLSVFDNLPMLKTLDMQVTPEKSQGYSYTFPFTTSRRVSLPDLRTFKMAGNARSCIWLLQHFAIPPMATLLVDCISPSRAEALEFPSLVTFISPHIHGGGSTSSTTSLSFRVYHGHLYMEGHREFRGCEEGRHPDERALSVTFTSAHTTTSGFGWILQDILGKLDLDKIISLDIAIACGSVIPVPTQLDLEKMSMGLTALERLSLSGPAVFSLVSPPGVRLTKIGAVGDRGPWLFPKLRYLKLAHFAFQKFTRCDEEDDDVVRNVFFEALEEMQARTDGGLKELIFEDCEVDQCAMDDLRCLVPNFSGGGSCSVFPSDSKAVDAHSDKI
ncbi:hypothetical protein DENSPDRAFT_417898 [Dentipellis sp. KUC8613]|nr:hypothetical protein DENSPDRAFT_417898 [Dentipellis sp. KUC8613]